MTDDHDHDCLGCQLLEHFTRGIVTHSRRGTLPLLVDDLLQATQAVHGLTFDPMPCTRDDADGVARELLAIITNLITQHTHAE